MIRKIFTLKNMLVILIIAGIIFVIEGISTYENEIKGLSYMMTGAAFIIMGLYLMVRLKEKL